MKTVAEFKRAMQVGAMVQATHHQEFAGRDEHGVVLYKDKDLGVREVSILQTTQFALKTTWKDGTIRDSWCKFPKASASRFNEDGSITLLEPDWRNIPGSGFEQDGLQTEKGRPLIPILTYKIVPEAREFDEHDQAVLYSIDNN